MLSVLLVGLTGCVAAPVEPTEASLELGTGTARFQSLTDGAELSMVRGAQGGWHVYLSVRATGLETGTGSLEIEHGPADDSAPTERSRSGVTFDPMDGEGRRVSLGWPIILSDPSCAVGRLHRIHATLTTATGERISAECDVMPTGGESPPPSCATE